MLFLLTACAPDQGIWRFQVTPGAEPECTTSVTHNLVGASPVAEPEDTDAWTETASSSVSDLVFLALLSDVGETMVMVVGTQTYDSSIEEGVWSFLDLRTSQSDRHLVHDSGYVRDELSETVSESGLEGDFSLRRFEGAWVSRASSIQSWTESDSWADETGVGENGEAPYSTWLVRDADGQPAAQTQDAAECSSDPCVLTVEQACDQSWTAVGQLTELPPEAWDGLQEAGREAGG